MGNVAYVEEGVNELVGKVHTLAWLGVRLENSLKEGFMVYHIPE